MKRDEPLDTLSAQALDAAWLRAALAPASPYGDRIFAELAAFRPGEEVAASARARRIARIAQRFTPAQLDAAREVLRNVPDAASAIARASMGDTLGDANLLELQRFFDACERLDALAENDADLPRPASEAVRVCARALELGRAGRFGFYLADGFDDGLTRARAAFAQAQAEYDAVRGRAAAAVARALGREITANEFIVMRADLAGPLPAGVRVVREAPTYLLCELDADEASLGALARRDEAASAVAEAEEVVRARLTSSVRAHAAALDAATRAFGECDVFIAAARFTQLHRCSVAEIVADGPFAFEAGRFVPLELELAREGRSFTAIGMHLDDVAVLTGPNMGGKSVCLRTCGFVALCAAYGVPVPAERASVPLFDEIVWLGAGTDAEMGGLLSSFAREVVRLRDALARERVRRLVLLDEFARTTTPREGRALLVAVLGRLRALGARALAATHLDGVADAAGARHFAVRGLRGIPERPATDDLHAALVTLAEQMDYTIEEVTHDGARRSDAIALAALLGLDDALTARAYDVLDGAS
ncbi:MAG: hypothetical protein KGN02_03055 [bacterium]|nr:hypothetical protein [bacterium]